MDIALIGPWFVLAVGTVTVLGAGWLTITKPEQRRPFWMWVFGVLLMGMGAYGPAFLSDYVRFVKVIMQMQEEPTRQNYATFLEGMAEGRVPERLQGVGTAVMLQHPIPDLERMLEQTADRAEEPRVKARLEDAKQALAAERARAGATTDQFLEGNLDRDELFRLPPPARFHVADELERRLEGAELERVIPADELRRLRGAPGIR